MPRTYLCFLWHMHQPLYKDLLTGEYGLPWARLHGLKDYLGMVRLLGEFPEVHVTFNLVPSLLVQLEEYAAGTASDPFLRLANARTEDLTEDEQLLILQYFFQATERMIGRFPRYRELYEIWIAAGRNPRQARRMFGVPALRDLQVLSQLAWFDEDTLSGAPDVRDLVRKGRGYSEEDQALVAGRQRDLLAEIVPAYREFSGHGQVELSTTPFYHPILPLLCDSGIAAVSHPHLPLPTAFRYPCDARAQLRRSRSFMEARFGLAPAGLWPSEGSVSEQSLAIAAEAGFRWFASDEGVLARSIDRTSVSGGAYRPWIWDAGGTEMRGVFRDHALSDFIGFVYANMHAADAVDHFLKEVRERTEATLSSGRDALVPVILDGENAWEYYEANGRPFLRELYGRISKTPGMEALTVSEALERVRPERLDRIFPGSWIGANFDIWIGAEEDNIAWEYLLRARAAYEAAVASDAPPAEADRDTALESLLIAEGSDWYWWYGPEHDSANRPEFDRMFRTHLANVYRCLGQPPPEELSRTILTSEQKSWHEPPASPIRPVIDGEVTSYFEWMGAGEFRPAARSGAMHGHHLLARRLLYGSDGRNLFLRLDFEDQPREYEFRLSTQPMRDGAPETELRACVSDAGVQIEFSGMAQVSARRVFELAVPLSALCVTPGHSLRFRVSLWKQGLPLDAIPQQGWIEFSTADPSA